MEKWLNERVLQRYLIKNYGKYSHNGQKIIGVKDNHDIYPDLTCTLEDGSEAPAEVEWKSSDFDHPLAPLLENHGFVFVFKKDREIGADIPQYIMDRDDFKKWFVEHASQIVEETVKQYEEVSRSRTSPKLWLTYLSLKAEGVTHFDIALKNQIWGVQEGYKGAVLKQIQTIQEGDLIAFTGPVKGFPGRVDLKGWTRPSFKGYFERLQLFRIIGGYFFEKTHIWPVKGKWVGEVFPHRFRFDPQPIVELRQIKVNRLTLVSRNELHRMVYSNITSGSPSTLLDIMYHSENNSQGPAEHNASS